MEEKNYTYSEKAAKWWANKVSSSTDCLVHGIVPFEQILAGKIRQNISINGQMSISTYRRRSTLLEEIADRTKLSADIPRGYEMRIIFDQVYVYDSQGQLVEFF